MSVQKWLFVDFSCAELCKKKCMFLKSTLQMAHFNSNCVICEYKLESSWVDYKISITKNNLLRRSLQQWCHNRYVPPWHSRLSEWKVNNVQHRCRCVPFFLSFFLSFFSLSAAVDLFDLRYREKHNT